MTPQQVELVRELCNDLASTKGVVYAALERLGASNIGEMIDYAALSEGPALVGFREELLPIAHALVLRVIYTKVAKAQDVKAATDLARLVLLRILRSGDSVGFLAPPRSGGPSGAAPAHAVVFRPGGRKAN